MENKVIGSRTAWRLIASVIVAAWAMNSPLVAADRPNIILIMADDLGWGDTGYNGHAQLKTPHLDAMAGAGMRFDRFYAAAPVCSPTRGSCLTGRHPYRYGILNANSGHMRRGEQTLAAILKRQGYATGHFGKWHLGTLTKRLKESNRGGPGGVKNYRPPWEVGFDESFSTEAKVPTWNPMLAPGTQRPYGTHYWTGPGELVKDNLEGDDSRVIMDRVVPFVQSASIKATPFFAVVWFHTPHLPVLAGPRHRKIYATLPESLQHYYGAITAMDEQIGRLRTELRRSGVAESTLLCFCSDNGPERNSAASGSTNGLRGRKRDLFEGGVRVPGLVEWPGKIMPGSVSAIPVTTSDYLPSILELLDLETDIEPLDGISLVPLFNGEMKQRPQPIGFQSGAKLALIDNRYKIIATARGRQKSGGKLDPHAFKLFDLLADAAEKNDLGASHPDIVRKMVGQLEAWRASCRLSESGKDY